MRVSFLSSRRSARLASVATIVARRWDVVGVDAMQSRFGLNKAVPHEKARHDRNHQPYEQPGQ